MQEERKSSYIPRLDPDHFPDQSTYGAFWQGEWTMSVVSIYNLEAMLEEESGVTHLWYVSEVLECRTKVAVVYSNPDEYGRPRPVSLHLPIYFPLGEKQAPAVVLDVVDTEANPDDFDGDMERCEDEQEWAAMTFDSIFNDIGREPLHWDPWEKKWLTK